MIHLQVIKTSIWFFGRLGGKKEKKEGGLVPQEGLKEGEESWESLEQMLEERT